VRVGSFKLPFSLSVTHREGIEQIALPAITDPAIFIARLTHRAGLRRQISSSGRIHEELIVVEAEIRGAVSCTDT
jgi:hypothetical protein